ncbi:unnamed protein product [Phytophthora fragariaefolia]|uniref:Unnamed protein product n=1 Tax=Phytophthora fragariaefolia TaxID=1490495 RepID=A0A9W6X335_9STRA|nr:unnamed protein product [Phytophthora fragariaefolia]
MSYLSRFELYAGIRDTGDRPESAFDNKTGAVAVVRNLKVVLGSKRHPWHTVVIDRFYLSVLLAIELLKMNVYVIGTIMTDRLGYDSNMKESLKQVGAIAVPCSPAVTDYQNWMGGVDINDQLRLQRISLQTSSRFLKYCKSLFLGFVDMAMVNAYLSHKEATRMSGTLAMARGEWFCLFQNLLLQLKGHDFAGVVVTPPFTGQKRRRAPVRHTHAPEQSKDWVTVTGVQKRRQRSCKVCALLRTDSSKKSYATTFFCKRCSLDDAKMWLCKKIRREFKGVTKTCFEIWHDDFDAGEVVPSTLGKRVVLRRLGQKAGARKKTRRELKLHANDGDNGIESDHEGDSDDV